MRKKPLYKRMFHTIRDVVTFRSFRRKLKTNIYKNEIAGRVKNIESELSGKIVYIFQHQFFDTMGEKCYFGGAERYCTDLADILTKNGYMPILIQQGDVKKGLWERTFNGLKVIGLPVLPELYVVAVSLFKKFEFVVYSGAVDWGKKLHPNVLISHGVTWDAPNKNYKLENVRRIFTDVDRLVSVDTNTLSWLRTTFPFDFDKMQMNFVPNYVDTSIYHPIDKTNDTTIQITFPRRLSSERGYWLMSEALVPIMEKYTNVVFDFVGFVHGEKVQKNVEELQRRFPNRIHHYVCEPDKMPAVYQKTDISLVPTLYAEGTSLSVLEASACGNVVISTNIGGLPNLILDSYNGLLINPCAKELLSVLDKVIGDKDLQKRLSQNAVSVAQSFDKSVWIKRWQNVVKEIETCRQVS